MTNQATILIIEDDPTFRSLLVAILEDEHYEVVEEKDGLQALLALRRRSYDLVLSDLRLPGMEGLDLFRAAKAEGLTPPFILLTAFGTVEEAVSALKEGVIDFLTKPLKDPDALRTLVRRTLESRRRELALTALRDREVAGMPPEKVLFAGTAMAKVRRLIANVAETPASVLISGESGTGKELAARIIHLASPRHDAGFVAINCAAIPENLMESELFGHEKGAFTGATQARPGKFELAAGGTLFLDEIGELPLALQAKLLRVLQERTFERLGGLREIRADVRIIAATNRNLATEIREKRFREDLFYRLNVFPIQLPPLRERRDGLPILTEYLALRADRQIGKAVSVVESEVHAAFANYDWPGNIRELQNVIERAVILSSGRITLSDLPELIRWPLKQSLVVTDGSLQEREREAILEMLARCGGNRRLAAERLGISKRTLQYRLKEYGMTDG
ncbi:MAG: sigma-54 dependent transcriptional regulator [Syntrophales bacterium]|jgi:DNA-binding NtrC family response regulator|nr:sigma-54 dependent transcriptional regulator [Syntrophales bacterium]